VAGFRRFPGSAGRHVDRHQHLRWSHLHPSRNLLAELGLYAGCGGRVV
jgi:hypothetical protein